MFLVGVDFSTISSSFVERSFFLIYCKWCFYCYNGRWAVCFNEGSNSLPRANISFVGERNPRWCCGASTVYIITSQFFLFSFNQCRLLAYCRVFLIQTMCSGGRGGSVIDCSLICITYNSVFGCLFPCRIMMMLLLI